MISYAYLMCLPSGYRTLLPLLLLLAQMLPLLPLVVNLPLPLLLDLLLVDQWALPLLVKLILLALKLSLHNKDHIGSRNFSDSLKSK
jgi:membrane protease YdiL (CAAX protease family)